MTFPRNHCSFIILALVVASFSIFFTRIADFSPFEVPDVFVSFSKCLWISLSILAVLLVLQIKDFESMSPQRGDYSCLLITVVVCIWSLFYIIPAFTNYPLYWKSTEEQVLFAKSLMYNVPEDIRWSTRNWGWPASYVLLIMFHRLLDIDILAASLYLATTLNFFIPVIIFLSCKRLVSKKSALLAPLLFALPQTYYYRYFSDYLYGFALFSILTYLVLLFKDDVRVKVLMTVFFASLTIGHPLTSLIYIIFLSLSSIYELFKFRNRGPARLLVLLATIFIAWYIYNQLAFQATSPYIVHILKMERATYAMSPQAYIRTPYHESLLYVFLYASRYFLFALLGVTTLIGLLVMIRRKNKRKAITLINLVLSSLIPWLILKVAVWESFDARFMIFGTLPVALASTYVTTTKLKRIIYIILLTIPISFALAFFPSTFMLFTHEFEFRGGEFAAYYAPSNVVVITDGYGANFVSIYNPHAQPLTYIDEATIFNVDPVKVHIPSGPHIVLRSLRQEVHAFILHRRDPMSFKLLDQRLSESHALCYNSRYSTIWFGN